MWHLIVLPSFLYSPHFIAIIIKTLIFCYKKRVILYVSYLKMERKHFNLAHSLFLFIFLKKLKSNACCKKLQKNLVLMDPGFLLAYFTSSWISCGDCIIRPILEMHKHTHLLTVFQVRYHLLIGSSILPCV